MTAERARLYALTLVARREYTAHEVRTKLIARACPQDIAAVVVDRLIAAGGIDDRRAAGVHVRTAAKVKKRGRLRIERELAARGVSKAVARELVGELSPQDEADAIRRILAAKRMPAKPDLATRRRLFQHLLRRGFSADAIGKVMRRPDLDEEDV
jgi:regulatory protein